jgi:AcrR family transcriptional regulator
LSPKGRRRPANRGAASSDPPLGLRERKKQKTRAAIQREAVRLFLEQGYDETTIEQIAEAAEISPSTFFNYFPTKEDVVVTDDSEPQFVATFLARPPDEPLGVALRATIDAFMPDLLGRDREMLVARARLMMETPALQARVWEDLVRTQDLFREVIAERAGRDPQDFELAVVSSVVIGALYAADLEWLRQGGGGDPVPFLHQALDIIEAGARLDALRSPGD